jgi:hypothetical protein
MLSRREWLRSSLVGAGAALVAYRFADAAPASAPVAITVYKSPTCGCCRAWVKHLESNGFKVAAHDLEQDKLTETKRTLNVPEALESCHTGVVGRYVFEGHIPADVITKTLNEKPNIIGLAVPGMPMGSPGMEGGSKQRYDVIAFERGGKTRVYASR